MAQILDFTNEVRVRIEAHEAVTFQGGAVVKTPAVKFVYVKNGEDDKHIELGLQEFLAHIGVLSEVRRI